MRPPGTFFFECFFSFCAAVDSDAEERSGALRLGLELNLHLWGNSFRRSLSGVQSVIDVGQENAVISPEKVQRV